MGNQPSRALPLNLSLTFTETVGMSLDSQHKETFSFLYKLQPWSGHFFKSATGAHR